MKLPVFGTMIVLLLFLAALGAGAFAWTLCIVAAIACAFAFITSLRQQASEEEVIPSLNPRVEHALAAILIFVMLTLLPLPTFMNALTGKDRSIQNVRVETVLADAEVVTPEIAQAHWFSLTRNRAGTMRIAIMIAAALGLFVMTTSLPQNWRKTYLRFLLLLGTGLAMAGYVGQWLIPQGDTLWWIIPIPHGSPGPVTCFVNRNHYAGLLAILAPVAVACLVDDIKQRRIVAILADLCGLAIISAGVFFSLSRGAFLSYFAGLIVIPVLFLARKRIIVAFLLTILVGSIAFGIQKLPNTNVRQRLETIKQGTASPDLIERASAWKDCLLIWRRYPLLGCGPNAFRMTFPQDRTTSARAYRTHAENEYAQTLAETGLAGIVLFVLLCFAICWRLFHPQRKEHTPLVLIAATGALAAAAVHATVDFAMHAPLYTLILTTIVAAALPPEQSNQKLCARMWPIGIALLSVLLLAPYAVRMGQRDNPRHIYQSDLAELSRTLAWSPVSWQTWLTIGDKLAREQVEEGTTLGNKCMGQAGYYDPNNYRLWARIGKMRLWLKDYDGARAAYKRAKALRFWVTVPKIPSE